MSKGRECSEETDRQGNAPIGRNREVMKSKLPDCPEQEAAHEVHRKGAYWEGGTRAVLHHPLKSVAGERPGRAEHDQKNDAHGNSAFRTPSLNKKLLSALGIPGVIIPCTP